MNKTTFVLMIHDFGLALFIVSMALAAFVIIVQFPRSDCHWGTVQTVGPPPGSSITGYVCPTGTGSFSVTSTLPRTSEPYLSYSLLLVVIAFVLIVASRYSISKSILRSLITYK